MILKELVFEYFDKNNKIKDSTVHFNHTYVNDYAERDEIEELFGTDEVEFEDWVEERIGVDYQVKYACGTIERYVNHSFIDDGINPAISYPSGRRVYYYKGNQFYAAYNPCKDEVSRALDRHLIEQKVVDDFYDKFG